MFVFPHSPMLNFEHIFLSSSSSTLNIDDDHVPSKIQKKRSPWETTHAPLRIDFCACWWLVQSGRRIITTQFWWFLVSPALTQGSTIHWYPLGKCLPRKRYQDGELRVALKIGECRWVTFKAQITNTMYTRVFAGSIGYLIGYFGMAKKACMKSIVLEHLWQLTRWSDQQQTVWLWEGILMCVANGMFLHIYRPYYLSYTKTSQLSNTLSCTALSSHTSLHDRHYILHPSRHQTK